MQTEPEPAAEAEAVVEQPETAAAESAAAESAAAESAAEKEQAPSTAGHTPYNSPCSSDDDEGKTQRKQAAETEAAEAEAVAENEPAAAEPAEKLVHVGLGIHMSVPVVVVVSIDTRIAVALRSVQPRIPEREPGITDGIRVLSEIEIVKEITTHHSFPLVARAISDAFKPDVPWTAQTRDRLVDKIKGKLPEFDDYEIMHLIRSLSYVYELENISCGQKYYDMSFHVKQAGIELEKMGKKPIDVMNYLRTRDELGVVSVDIIPNDDMLLGLAICQTKTIRNAIHHVPTPDRPQKPLLMYNLVELASQNLR